MSQPVYEGGSKTNMTSTTTVTPLSGNNVNLVGVFVSQASATPTVKVADTAGTIANTFTPIAGTFYPLPCVLSGAWTVTISGTVDLTVFWSS